MFFRQTFLALTICLLAVSLTFPPEIMADVTKRVVFPKGKKTVSYKGKLPKQYASYDAYVLRAKKGQTITVKLTTADADASFSIYETKELGPEEDAIYSNTQEILHEWSGKLPITSEYSVQIYGVSNIDDKDVSGAAYTIEISLR